MEFLSNNHRFPTRWIVPAFYAERFKYDIYIVPFPFCSARYLNDARILQGTKFSDILTDGKVNNVKISFWSSNFMETHCKLKICENMEYIGDR